MPFVLAALVLLILPALFLLAVPLSLVRRYRVGTARRPARGWVAAFNVLALALSTGLFLAAAAVSGLWVPHALAAALAGLAAGGVLGLLGLAATRWEAAPGSLHFTPSRWLVLVIMLVVTSRLLYGLWRAWTAWRSTGPGTGWLAEAGLAGSLAAGALVLGYTLTYWVGVRRRLLREGRTAPAR